MKDKEIQNLIKAEKRRQETAVDLIASENFVSNDVLEALGSVFTNKYAEGYPGARYYGGNAVVDDLERLAGKRALKLYRLDPKKWSVNVQPYSGSPANLAVLHALVPVGGKVMGMDLNMGGHLTHGYRASVTGKLWRQAPYGVDKKTECIDYGGLMKIAKKAKPKLIIAGGSAYSRVVDFKKFRKMADTVDALLLIDMSHFAGLVAGGAYPSPFPYADVVMTTTHKTLRGPRAAIIFSRRTAIPHSKLSIPDLIDRSVFPGLQGGPHANAIAAVAVALKEASAPAFKKYAQQVVRNARTLAFELQKRGWRIVSGGTDTHLFLMDTWERGIGGKEASERLEKAGIIVNKNMIPYDTRKPSDPSGIRIGTAAVTTRGLKEKDMRRLAERMDKTLSR
ncbi:serine hydroxymethyltransferase [Patescibacteria group bacterium]|nr:serine hydroxymethyltransferase [Patescibacteria group bacterium]